MEQEVQGSNDDVVEAVVVLGKMGILKEPCAQRLCVG